MKDTYFVCSWYVPDTVNPRPLVAYLRWVEFVDKANGLYMRLNMTFTSEELHDEHTRPVCLRHTATLLALRIGLQLYPTIENQEKSGQQSRDKRYIVIIDMAHTTTRDWSTYA